MADARIRYPYVIAGLAVVAFAYGLVTLRQPIPQATAAPVLREVEFVATAGRVTFASVNGEMVASTETYPLAPGAVVVLTVQANDPAEPGGCGIAVDGAIVNTAQAHAPNPATCVVIVR